MSSGGVDALPLPTDVLQFLSIVVFQLVVVIVFFILFLVVRSKWPELIALHRPDGPLATAKGMVGWLAQLRQVDDEALLEAGGADGVLYCWRASMHAELVAILVVTSMPLAIIFALASDANEGLARITLANALAPPVGVWRLWLTVLGVWVNTLLSVRAVDRFDIDIAEYAVRHLRTSPPLHHYAAVVTDLPKTATREVVRSFFTNMYGDDSIIGVHQLRKYSAPGAKKGDEGHATSSTADRADGSATDSATRKPSLLDRLTGKKVQNGSLRVAVDIYAAALKKLAAADAAALAEARKEASTGKKAKPGFMSGGKTKAEKAAEARVAAQEARAALSSAVATAPQYEPDGNGPGEALEGKVIPPRARAAVITFGSLMQAVVAITSPLLVSGAEGATPGRAWVLWPAPEARDIDWKLLENLRPARLRENSRLISIAIKTAMTVWWSVLVALLQAGIVAALTFAAQVPVPPLQTFLVIVSGIVPLAIQDFMLNFMAVILRVLNTQLGGYWSHSAIERAVQADYTNFLRAVAFFAAMLGSSLFSAIWEIGNEPTRIFFLLANSVPASSGVMMAYVFLRACTVAKNSLGVVPAIVSKVKLALLAKTPFARAEVVRPKPPTAGVKASWDGFVLLVALAYAPIAPLTAVVCALYFGAAALEARIDVVSMSAPIFDTAGALTTLAAQQALDAVSLAALIHFAIILLSGSSGTAWHAFAVLPLPIPILMARARMRQRHATGPHGAPRGRLPMVDAAAVDAARDAGHLKSLHAQLGGKLRAWAPPCAPGSGGGAEAASASTPPVGPPVPPPPPTGADDSAVDESALVELHEWLRRYESPDVTKYKNAQGGEDDAAAAIAAAAAAQGVEEDEVADDVDDEMTS